MQSPPRADPPYVPIRHTAWPVRRTPRWLFAAGLAIVVAGVLVGLAVHPSRSQRATDLNGFLTDMKYDIQSCAGGVRDSLTAMRAINAGTSHDVGTAIGIATYGSGNCSPANNMQLDDLVGYQVHESLSSFRLDRVVYGLVDWATPDALRVQADVAAVLRAQGTARAAATTKLDSDLKILDAQRAYLDKIMMAAMTAIGGHRTAAPPAGLKSTSATGAPGTLPRHGPPKADVLQGHGERGLPGGGEPGGTRRRRLHPVKRGQDTPDHLLGPGRGHVGVAKLQFVLEVVAAVPLHHVEQQQ